MAKSKIEAVEEVIENATEKATNSKIELVVKVAFTDKNDASKHYQIGDVIKVDEARAKELLADSRLLVSKA